MKKSIQELILKKDQEMINLAFKQNPEDFWTDITGSSNIARIAHNHNPERPLLWVAFKTGSVYEYEAVPLQDYYDIMAADSIGSKFHELVIKPGYNYQKIKPTL